MTIIAAILAAAVAGAAGALAYGYRGQRDQEREQVNYLRRQLEARGPHVTSTSGHPRVIEGR